MRILCILLLACLTSTSAPAKENFNERAIDSFHMAEVLYDLGFDSPLRESTIIEFTAALHRYDFALSSPDTQNMSHIIISQAKYKSGWCHFRLAELGKDRLLNLQKAFSFFADVTKNTTAPHYNEALYMAGEMKLREAILCRYYFLTNEEEAEEINKILTLLEEAKDYFQLVTTKFPASSDLGRSALTRLQDITYAKGKLYQWDFNSTVFKNIDDANKRSNSVMTAMHYFDKTNYETLYASLQDTTRWQLKSTIDYLTAMVPLQKHMLRSSGEAVITIEEYLDRLYQAEYQKEVHFRLGNMHQSFPCCTEDKIVSEYSEALPEIPESYFWIGLATLCQGEYSRGNDFPPTNFTTYLTTVSADDSYDSRVGILKFYAEMGYSFANNCRPKALDRDFLCTLEERVERMGDLSFCSAEFQYDLFMMRCLALQICRRPNERDTNFCDVDDMELIRFSIRFASCLGGEFRNEVLDFILKRLHYFENNPAFELNEIKYYQGLTFYLLAQSFDERDNPGQILEKANHFFEQISINSDFHTESQYAQGMCLMNDAYWNHQESPDAAEHIFRELFTKNGHIAAAYQLAGIYSNDSRSGNRDMMLEARIISAAIYHKTKNHKKNSPWLRWIKSLYPAIASIDPEKPEVREKTEMLANPEDTLQINGQDASFHRLIEPFCQDRLWFELDDLLQRYSPPKRELYPSKHSPRNSIYGGSNALPQFSAGIDER